MANEYPQSRGTKTLIGLLVFLVLTGWLSNRLLCTHDSTESQLAELRPETIPNDRKTQLESLYSLLKDDPSDYKTRHKIGKLLIEEQEYKRAVHELEKADKDSIRHNADKETRYNILTDLALAYSKKKDFDKAIETLKRAKRLKPDSPTAYNKTGNVLEKKKKPEKARKEYLKAKDLDKKDPEAYRNLANQEFNKKNNKKAIGLLKDAVRNNPGHYKAFENLGDGYVRIGEYEKGVHSYDRALALNPPATAQSRILRKKAYALSKLGKNEESLAALKRAVRVNPKDAKAWELLGDDFLKKGDKKQALAHYRKALRQGTNPPLAKKYERVYADLKKELENKNRPKETVSKNQTDDSKQDAGTKGTPSDDNEIVIKNENTGDSKGDKTKAAKYIQKGVEYFKAKQYPAAESAFLQAQKMDPESAQIAYMIARAQDKQNKIEQAIRNYNDAAAKDPKDGKSHYYLGILYFKMQRYTDALREFELAVRLDPKMAKAWYSRGLTADKLRKNSLAVSSYQKALEIKPNFYEAQFNLGISLKKSGRYSDALSAFEKSRSLRPEAADIDYQIGEVYVRLHNETKAEDYFKKALAREPNHYEARFNLGLLYNRTGKHDEAIRIFQKLIAENSADVPSHYELGKAFEALTRKNEAIAQYRKAVTLSPQYYKAWLNLGRLYSSTGLTEQAAAAYKKAIQIAPEKFDPPANLANMYAREKMYEQAIEYYKKALTIKPEAIETRLAYAESLEQAKRYEDALRQYNIILKQSPKNKLALEKLGFLYYRKLKQKQEAKTAFEKLLRVYPNHPKATDIRNIIETL